MLLWCRQQLKEVRGRLERAEQQNDEMARLLEHASQPGRYEESHDSFSRFQSSEGDCSSELPSFTSFLHDRTILRALILNNEAMGCQ